MKSNAIRIILLLILSLPVYSQLPNNNMRLLANKNEHYVNNYSAICGYTAPNGREYAILGCSEGTAFYDITDTNNITESGFIQGLSSLWREFKTFGHYAYIVSEAVGSGMQIVDLQYLPDSLRLINTVTFTGYSRTHTISQSGPYLYLNGADYNNAGIFIFDISQDPVHPLKRGNWYENYIHDCRVVNDTIWAAAIFNGHIYVIDATNKDSLRTITTWVNLPDPGPHNTALTDDRKFLLVTDEIGGIPRLLKTWNVQNVFNPQLAATWQPTGMDSSIVHNVEIYGNCALVAHYSAGVRLVDISNPLVPVEVAWYDTFPQNNSFNYFGCWGAYLFPSGKIIASDRATGLYVLKSSITTIGIGGNNNNIPREYSLKQNYPNPFNPVTKIEYSIPENAYVRIKIYNVTGELIGVISDKYEQAGSHFVVYDASRLSSGVFFYTMEEGDGVILQTKRMVLIIK